MATAILNAHSPLPSPPANQFKTPVIPELHNPTTSGKPALLVCFGYGQEHILKELADVLDQPWRTVGSLREAQSADPKTVVGILASDVSLQQEQYDQRRIVLNAHCIDGGEALNESLSSQCDYEYLYSQRPFDKRDLARFLSFVTGQVNPHWHLSRKARTTLISTTFPDVHNALPNMEILSVGADAVELRVDLLEEPLPGGGVSPVPSVKYVGEQHMMLRRKTELPIIYTTRSMNENGRFPMQDPGLFERYLMKARQWGCEYIDVGLWLPEDIRRRIAERKGNSKIISSFHDFSRTFKWTSPLAQELFANGAVYGDVVKMMVLISNVQENYELEHFRSMIESQYDHPRLSGLNMGPAGQLSRTSNQVFTPITHPLLPRIAAAGQLSAAEINQALHSIGQMPKLDFYGIGSDQSRTQTIFFEKCFNELGLPHQFNFIERAPKGYVETIVKRTSFGGACIHPPLAADEPYLLDLSDAARATGQVDTIAIGEENGQRRLIGENALWKAIRLTLCMDFVPSAYARRAALVLADHEFDAIPVVYALESLGVGPIYTIGFRTTGSLASKITPVNAVEDLKQLEQPFAILSALPAEKSLLVRPLLKHYSTSGQQAGVATGKVFVDLANGPKKGDTMALATSMGWTVYDSVDVNAWTTVETFRLLVGQKVPYDFVRLASGRTMA